MASASMNICSTSDELKAALNKFRFRKEKTLGAIMMKINKTKLTVEIEEEWEDTTIEEVVNEFAPQQPRYVAISYPLKHDDGRVSYPLFFLYLSPQGCSPELHMMYAGSKNGVVNDGQFTKVFEYRNSDDITDEAIQERLKKM